MRIAWSALALVMMAIIALRLEPVFDLAQFLPAPNNAQEQVLLERLGQGPGSRFLMLGLKDAGDDTLEVRGTTAIDDFTISGTAVTSAAQPRRVAACNSDQV